MLSVMEAIRRRRSVRNFKPDPVPKQTIDLMLEAARLAPSGSNRQPWRFQVVTDASLRERIFLEATFGSRHIQEAPVWIVCGSELLSYVKGNRLAPSSAILAADNDDWETLKPFLADAQMNTAIAIEHMVLAATDEGLGTCWIGAFSQDKARKALGVPEKYKVVTVLPVGYAAGETAPRSKKPLSEIVCNEKFSE